jgi:S-adenosyl methyltransferase
MSDSPRQPGDRAESPTPAGIYDYLLGGRHHSAADREAAEKALAIAPEARSVAKENRAFLRRAVSYIAERGVRQYIDLGSGFPSRGAVHEIAGRFVPDPHVLYVDYDQTAAKVSRAMLASYPHAEILARDLRQPWDVIDAPETARLIDWAKPVAVLMVAVLHFVGDDDRPGEIIATFRDQMGPGSYLVLTHGSAGENPQDAREAAHAWDQTRSPVRLRTPSEVDGWFVGFEMVGPGLVTAREWGTEEPAAHDQAVMLAGVGRIPPHSDA